MYDIPVPEVEDEENLERLETDVCCSGTPVSCGEVTARAAVITSLDEVHLLRQGTREASTGFRFGFQNQIIDVHFSLQNLRHSDDYPISFFCLL